MKTNATRIAIAMLLVGSALPVFAQETTTVTTGTETTVATPKEGFRRFLPPFLKRGARAEKREGERKEVRENEGAGNADVDAACVAKAVDAREASVSSAVSIKSTATMNALATRRSALASAWAQTDVTMRASAVKSAWEAFRMAGKASNETLKKSHKDALVAYKTAVKACRGGASVQDNSVAGEVELL